MIWAALVILGLFVMWIYKKVCESERSMYDIYEDVQDKYEEQEEIL